MRLLSDSKRSLNIVQTKDEQKETRTVSEQSKSIRCNGYDRSPIIGCLGSSNTAVQTN